MAKNVSSVYLDVVDDVVDKMCDSTVDRAGDDTVLSELQALWELKLIRSGVVQGPIERNPLHSRTPVPTPVHDLIVLPNEGTGDYVNPIADILFPSFLWFKDTFGATLQTPSSVETGQVRSPLVRSVHAVTCDAETEKDAFKQLSIPWMDQGALGVDVNIANNESSVAEGKNNSELQPLTEDCLITSPCKKAHIEYQPCVLADEYIPQQDGSADTALNLKRHPDHGKHLKSKIADDDWSVAT